MRGGEPRTTMETRPGLSVVVVVSLLTILPGTNQHPQNVVFQPVTTQLTSIGQIDPDLSLVFSPTLRESSESAEDTSNQLICKKIQHGDGLFRVSTPTQANELFFTTASVVQPLSESPFSRFFVAVPSVPSLEISAESIHSEIPEGTLAAPPPLMASLCVSQDSPRPFPVLFAPPPPSHFSSIDNDFRKDMFMSPSDASYYYTQTSRLENPFKVSLNTPSMGGVTFALHGVPATIESTSPSRDDPAGRILVNLHTNPPGSITLGFTGDIKTSRKPEDFETYRGNGILTNPLSPSVSLVFSKPVGSIGIGSANSPAINIEKQNILTSPEMSLAKNTFKNNNFPRSN